ncbi:Ubiquitin-protein ligase BRE1 [Paragonimus heterotremus]|uniref:Ubiquitin-protein ligase BRE1 n=1 Tax=Paragonimus heterotremus TaxID=100268 RepID=A0A8J4SL75_9TREM|nr:Ubiquitin-protein ligase BRE1 [Paragonimus heterotremus]
MESAISAEEFQRFQSQLLDLREEQIQATDMRLRAEARVRHLEEELSTALKLAESYKYDAAHAQDVLQDNKRLREKLLSTESSFQLQSSTLRAECHRLTTELDRLELILNKPTQTQSCQTALGVSSLSDAFVQTDETLDAITDTDSASSFAIIAELQSALSVTEVTNSLLTQTISTLEHKLSELESCVQTDLYGLRSRLSELVTERSALLERLRDLEAVITNAADTERDLRGQLDLVRSRGEKVNRELRRQLCRLVRAQQSELEQLSLNRCSVYSSSSSLSSNINSGSTTTASNGELAANHPDTSERKSVDDPVPSGLFSMADFKALIDRMSEVQEENCAFRRRIQRLESQLAEKSKLIQAELHTRLVGNSDAPHNRITHAGISNMKFPGTTISSTATQSAFSWLSLLKPSSTSANLSITNLETINRLKKMCEELITQNMQLSDELDRLRDRN